MSRQQERLFRTPSDTPALFFCRDMKGYGLLFRKGRLLNVGLGRMDMTNLTSHTRDFCSFLKQRGDLPAGFSGTFQGHAYRLYQRQGGRCCVSDGALLLGDAAGLSYPQSGEGILPAIESALLASDTILAANGDYRHDNLEPYAAHLAIRFGSSMKSLSPPHVSGLVRFIGAKLLSSSWFVRHIVLGHWFLHTDQQTLYAPPVHPESGRQP
jgi:flavin-dependent dehydrogenase